jgi:hypothetical protein
VSASCCSRPSRSSSSPAAHHSTAQDVHERVVPAHGVASLNPQHSRAARQHSPHCTVHARTHTHTGVSAKEANGQRGIDGGQGHEPWHAAVEAAHITRQAGGLWAAGAGAGGGGKTCTCVNTAQLHCQHGDPQARPSASAITTTTSTPDSRPARRGGRGTALPRRPARRQRTTTSQAGPPRCQQTEGSSGQPPAAADSAR